MKRVLLFKRIVIFLAMFLIIASFSSCTCNHNFSDATCTEPATCKKCGQTQGEALGHSFSEATCTEPERCIRCGKVNGVALGHTVTCADNKPCNRCGEKIDHSFRGNIKTGSIYCRGCSAQVNRSTINHKDIGLLSQAEKAYVQWVINSYMTAVDSSGHYLYSTEKAYAKAASELGYTSYQMKSFWENHIGLAAYNSIYS